MNFSDDSDLEDPVSVEAQLAEGSKRQGTASRCRGRARKGPSVKTNSVAMSDNAPGLSGRSRRVRKVASGHCEQLGPEMMRTIPEEELTDNQMEMSFEILRGSDGEDSASGVRARVGGRGPFFFQGCPGVKTQEINGAKDGTERKFFCWLWDWTLEGRARG